MSEVRTVLRYGVLSFLGSDTNWVVSIRIELNRKIPSWCQRMILECRLQALMLIKY